MIDKKLIIYDKNNIEELVVYDKNFKILPTKQFYLNNVLYLNNNFILMENKEIFNKKWNSNLNIKSENEKYNNEINLKNTKINNNKCISFNTIYISNYYHFIIDFLPKIFIYKELNLNNDIYINRKNFSRFQLEFFELIDFDYTKMKLFENDVLFKNEMIILSDTKGIGILKEGIPKYPIECMKKLLNKLIKEKKIVKKDKKNIYITRKNSNYRHINNEEIIINLIKKYNFLIVELENISVLEQIDLFYNSNIVLAPHGAGSTNIIFGDNIKVYIEIHNKNYVKMDNCFHQICDNLNIPHYCVHSNSVNNIKPHLSNFKFDNLECLEKLIKKYYIMK